MTNNFDIIKEEFDKYVSNFDMENSKIALKYHHSYRVVSYMNRIAKSENLNKHDFYLAQVIAMFHDIARFEQATKYDTFFDLISFDHGNRGAEIMQENDWISKFVDNDKDKQIIIKSIKNHNKYQIEDGLSKRELYFAKMIRDADKLDIMNTQYEGQGAKQAEINEEILESIRNNKPYERSKKTIEMNFATRLCMMFCFVFDFNYLETYKIAVNDDILQKKYKVLKKYGLTEEKVSEIIDIINTYMDNKINE